MSLKSAAARTLFAPFQTSAPGMESDYARGVAEGRADAERELRDACAAIEAAAGAAGVDAAAAIAQARRESLDLLARLLAATAPRLAAAATLDALARALPQPPEIRDGLRLAVAADIADAVRVLAPDAEVTIDPALPAGAAVARWRGGGVDAAPLLSIDAVITALLTHLEQEDAR